MATSDLNLRMNLVIQITSDTKSDDKIGFQLKPKFDWCLDFQLNQAIMIKMVNLCRNLPFFVKLDLKYVDYINFL